MSALAQIGATQWENKTERSVGRPTGGGDGGHRSRRPPAGVPAGGSQPGRSGRELCSATISNLAGMLFRAIVRRFIFKANWITCSGNDGGSPMGRCRPPTSPEPVAPPIPTPRRASAIGKTAGLKAKGAGCQGFSGRGLSPARTHDCFRLFPWFFGRLCPNVLDRCHAVNGGHRRRGWRLNGGRWFIRCPSRRSYGCGRGELLVRGDRV
jgi:hypothetical protein